MYKGNANIDKPVAFITDEIVEQVFIFCQLDRAMPYEKVVNTYEHLRKNKINNFNSIKKIEYQSLYLILKQSGFRFPRQVAMYLKENAYHLNGKKLQVMTRNEIVKECRGFVYKLPILFYNIIHPNNQIYAIIDVHVDRYLKRQGCNESNYIKKEKFLKVLAEKEKKTLEQLDWEIWNGNRIGNKKRGKYVKSK